MREQRDSRGQRLVAVAARTGVVEKRLAETHMPPIQAVARTLRPV